jgi:prepilin-type N-terminal cleavage/methylation domain-containing protein
MKSSNSGFTLAEVLVAVVIGAMSILAAFSSYNYFQKSHNSVSQKAAVNSSAREVLALIARDLRNTGYYHIDFENNNCEALNQSQYDYIGVTHNKNWINGKYKQSDGLMVTYSISAKERIRIQYFMTKYQNSSEWYLKRVVNVNPIGHSRSGCGPWTRNYNMPVDDEVLAPYVEDFQVIPKDKEGNVVFPVCTSCSNYENSQGGQTKSKENMKKVNTVDIYLTLRSPKEVFARAKPTKIINGASPYGSNIDVPADKFFRETFFVSVHTRNLAKHVALSEKTGTSIGETSTYNK